MPGLIGVAGQRGPGDAVDRFRVAVDRMLRHPGTTADTFSALNGTCLIGHVRLSSADDMAGAERAPSERATALAIFHGVLYNEAALRKQLGSNAPTGEVSALLVALHQRFGEQFVDQLEGEFCVALVDPNQHQLFVATDPIGHYPIYWRADADGIIVSSDLSALLKAALQASRLDLRAVADYLTIGAVLGDKTLAHGVNTLAPGTVLRYDLEKSTASLRQYLKLETLFQPKVSDKREFMERLQSSFVSAVTRATRGSRAVGLSLSGGLDSRALLAALGDGAAGVSTYTLGVEGCADQVIADQLASITKTHHTFFRLDSTYLHDFLPNIAQMVSITDGMYLSHGLTEMLALQFLDQTGIRVLLRGHGGELAKAHLAWPLHTDPQVYTLSSLSELVPYLSARANYVTPHLALSAILSPEAARVAGEGTKDTFAEVLAGTGLSPADACSYLYLRELNRRFTVPSLELFRTRVEVRLPYLDSEFLRVLLAAPSRWRDTTEIHRHLTRTGVPRLLKVRNSNTGAPVDAGPLTEAVMDKGNTLLKRLNVRGYRHYHDFDGWMRSMLLQSVEAELFAPTARVQAFVPKHVLEGLVTETRQGAADRAYLLQILLILELWQRENGVEAAA